MTATSEKVIDMCGLLGKHRPPQRAEILAEELVLNSARIHGASANTIALIRAKIAEINFILDQVERVLRSSDTAARTGAAHLSKGGHNG